MKPVLKLAILLLPLLATACNTIEGMGQDVSAGGKALANTADKTKQEISK
jgi:predicted small secreted protein